MDVVKQVSEGSGKKDKEIMVRELGEGMCGAGATEAGLIVDEYRRKWSSRVMTTLVSTSAPKPELPRGGSLTIKPLRQMNKG